MTTDELGQKGSIKSGSVGCLSIGSVTILTTESFQVMSKESYLAPLCPHSDALAGGPLDQVYVLQRTAVK